MKQLRGRTSVFTLFLILPALSLALTGCARSRAAAGPATPKAAVAPAAPPPSATPRPQTSSIRSSPPASGARSSPQAPAAAPPPATPGTGPELLASERGALVAPRDFRIGPLHLPEPSSASIQEAAEVLTLFMDGMRDGKVSGDLVDPRSKDRIERTLAFHASKGAIPSRYRVGKLRETEAGEILANLRLYGQSGVTEGEIYLIRVDGAWKVGDVQAGLSQLLERYEAPQEPFVPSSYEYSASAPSAVDGEAGAAGSPRPEKE